MIIRFQRCLAACGRHGGVFDIGKDQKTSYAFPILCIASASDVMGKMTRKPKYCTFIVYQYILNWTTTTVMISGMIDIWSFFE